MQFVTTKNKKGEILAWVTAILLYLLFYPFFIWKFVEFFNWAVSLPLFIVLLSQIDKKTDTKYAVAFVALLLIASFCSRQSFAGTIFFILAVSIFTVRKDFLFEVYKKFRLLYIVLMALSLLSLLFVVLGIDSSVRVIEPVNSLKEYNYFAYTFFVVDMKDPGRFCGVFDEPGMVGMLSSLLLYIEKCNLKKPGNIVILFSGLMSLSVFFYIVFFILLLFLLFARPTRKSEKLAFLTFLVAGAVFVSVNPIANERILERVQWDEDSQQFSGDDRASIGLKNYVESIRGTTQYFWGVDDNDDIEKYSNSASILNAILIYGLVVVICFFLFYLAYSHKYLKSSLSFLMFMLFLFMLIYNRPTMFKISNLFLYNMCIYSHSAIYKAYFDNKKLLANGITEE